MRTVPLVLPMRHDGLAVTTRVHGPVTRAEWLRERTQQRRARPDYVALTVAVRAMHGPVCDCTTCQRFDQTIGDSA